MTLNFVQPGSVGFSYRGSSEPSFDFLRFYIDTRQQGPGWSGSVPWSQKSYSVAAASMS